MSAPSPGRKRHKWFSEEQIREKIANRSADVPQYKTLLFECFVEQKEGGSVFDSEHTSWKTLVKLVKQAEKDAKEAKLQDTSSQSASNEWVHVPKVINVAELTQADLLKELKQPTPDLGRIRKHCLLHGVPNESRAEVWKQLLLGNKAISPFEFTAGLDLQNQRVIRADIDRTLPKLARFQDKQVRADMEVILTTYCKEQQFSYKQGMNYVLAPFMLVMEDRDLMYFAYSALIARLLPNTFNDEEFGGLQCIFALFRLLLLYHDPELAQFLDKNDMGPELYAASWFLTLHANRCAQEVLLYLWDHILLNEDVLYHYFISLALLISQREKILVENPVTLPEMLSKLNITSEHEVDELVAKATNYRDQTPSSFRALFLERIQKKVSIDSREYETIKEAGCLFVSAEELVRHGAAKSPAAEDAVRYFLLDCRPLEQYESGHLGSAFHIDPKLVDDKDALEKKVQEFASVKSCNLHFCFISSEDEENRAQRAFLNDFFLERRFQYVSNCQGGYEACHALVAASNGTFELVDHKRNKCLCCNGTRVAKPSQRKSASGRDKFLSSMRERLNKITIHVANPVDEQSDEEKPVEDTPELKAKRANTRYQRSHLPDTCEVMSRSNYSRILHTVLRDKHSRGVAFAAVVNQLIAMVVAMAFEKLEMQDVDVTTFSGGHVTGRTCHDLLCGVTCSRAGEAALEAALLPFGSVLGIAFGRMEVEERAEDDSSAASGPTAVSLPADIASRSVFLCEPVISPNLQDMVSCIAELKARGVSEERIFVLAAVAAREVLWRVFEAHPKVVLLVGKVDEFTAGRLVPGVARCQERYFSPVPGPASPSKSRSLSNDAKP